VYGDTLVGMCNYSGDFTRIPWDVPIYSMIKKLGGKWPAYTLDVAVISEYVSEVDNFEFKVVPIEVHEFFSCGLYGFQYYRILPQMFIRTFNNIIRRGRQ
jgi:hypothetical protein